MTTIISKRIEAPAIHAHELWKMNPEEFNQWRKKYDYPRIVHFFKEKLPLFKEWMKDQNVEDEILIEYSPSNFLKEREIIHLYTIIDKDTEEQTVVLREDNNLSDARLSKQVIRNKKSIIPYPNWYYKNSKTKEPLNLEMTYSSGRNHYFKGELGLLDLGNSKLSSGFYLGDRNLDFVSLAGLLQL